MRNVEQRAFFLPGVTVRNCVYHVLALMCTVFQCLIRNNLITIQTNMKAQMNCKALVPNRMHANGATYLLFYNSRTDSRDHATGICKTATMQLPSATCNIKMFRVASTTDLLKQHLS